MKHTRMLMVVGLVAATAVLGGCATSTYGPRYTETVYVAPPPPRVEYVGAPPVVGHVWITGFWSWGGSRYVWVPGRWEAPRHGEHWVPHRWERDGDRWRQHGGFWEKSSGFVEQRRPPAPQPAPAVEPRRDYREAPERRDHGQWSGWNNRQDHREAREPARDVRNEMPRVERSEAPRIDRTNDQERHGRGNWMHREQAAGAPRHEAPRIAMESPRPAVAPAPEVRRESRSEARSEGRSESRADNRADERGGHDRRGRNEDDNRRDRGRDRN